MALGIRRLPSCQWLGGVPSWAVGGLARDGVAGTEASTAAVGVAANLRDLFSLAYGLAATFHRKLPGALLAGIPFAPHACSTTA
jgi:hypothetical protein